MNTVDNQAFTELVKQNRSYRRFDESKPIAQQTLVQLIELTRFCGSGANMQALKFCAATAEAAGEAIFPTLNWAGYLKDWDGPAAGERPTGYVVILGDTELKSSFGVDPGIAAQTMLLGAITRGYGGCMIGSIRRESLRQALGIPERYEILLVIALGAPGETVVIEDVNDDGGIEYYRDADGVHHVPKRRLEEILLDLPPKG